MNAVEFVMKMRDNASSTIDKIGKEFGHANTKATKLQGTMQRLSTSGTSMFGSLNSMLTTFGIGFSLYKVADMMRVGTEKAHELRLAQTQVQASLLSTGHAAGIMYDETLKQAKKLSYSTLYGRAEITDMQSMLLTFPSVSKKTFEAASGAILDMSTKMHQDVKMSTVMVGKALQDPKYGVMALRRVGVNLTREQAVIIKNLVASGHKDIAQAMILKELNTEFGGSAKAAFDATPLARYNKIVGSIQLKMGELAERVQEKLAPALESIATIAGKALHPVRIVLGWIFRQLESGNPIVSAIVATLGTFALIIGIVSAATAIWTAVNWALDMSLLANPIVWIIAIIVGFVAGIVLAYQKVGWFRGAVLASWEAIKGFGLLIKDYVVDRITGVINGLGKLGKAFYQFFVKRDWKAAWDTAKDAGSDLFGLKADSNAVNNLKKIGKNMGTAYHKGVLEAATNNKASKEKKTIPGTNVAYGMNGGNDKLGNKGAATAVATGGTRNTSINIHLGKMFENIVFQGGLKENKQDLEKQLEEMFMRLLYSAQSVG